jgi:transcriptional regulator with XRE-family HTH domain
MDDKRKEIGLRIRSIRKKLNLSQEEFASRVGTSGSTISSYEIGDSFCSLPVLFRIADIGYTTPGWLLMGTKDSPTIEEILSKEDIRLLKAFHRASEKDRELILRMAEAVAESKTK